MSEVKHEKIINDFIIVVDGNFANQRYIIKEHWLLITSQNFIKSGFYKGKVFNTTQEKAA